MAALVVTGVFVWNLISKENPDGNITDPADTAQTFEFKIDDYTYFNLEGLDFGFVLAKLSVYSNKPINLSLSHFSTDGNITLNSVDTYLSALEAEGYSLSNQSVVFGLNSTSTQLSSVLFIPVADKSQTKSILNINLNPSAVLEFDLTDPSHQGTSEQLGVQTQANDPVSVADIRLLYKSMVSTSDIYVMDANGQKSQASFTSQSQVIGIKLSITNKLKDGFRITGARIKSKSGDTFDALSKDYLVEGIQNFSNQYIKGTQEGYLFFEVLGTELTVEDFTSVELGLSGLENGIFYTIDLSGGQ